MKKSSSSSSTNSDSSSPTTAPSYDSDDEQSEIQQDASTSTLHIAATGNLSSHPLSMDLKFDHFSVSVSSPFSSQSIDLIDDTDLCLNRGTRYGLIGLNGSGKVCF